MLTSIIGWEKGSELARVIEPPEMISFRMQSSAVLYPYVRRDED